MTGTIRGDVVLNFVMGSFQWRIGICLTSVIVYQNLIFHAWGEVVVPAANCSSLGAVKLTHRVFLKSRVVILRGFDDTLVASGDEYLQTKLLHNIAYQQLTARDEAFVFVDQIARNGKLGEELDKFSHKCHCIEVALKYSVSIIGLDSFTVSLFILCLFRKSLPSREGKRLKMRRALHDHRDNTVLACNDIASRKMHQLPACNIENRISSGFF